MQKVYLTIPPTWRDVYLKVKEQYPDALLAGGCLRDLDNNREVKDLDIFVHTPAPHWFSPNPVIAKDDTIRLHVKLEGYEEDREQSFDSSDTPDNTLVGTTVLVKDGELPVNIIYLKGSVSPQDRCDRFDFGFNKITYDGVNVSASFEYFEDVLNQRMTLRRINNLEQVIKSLQRAQKFQEKYKGWPLLIPGGIINTFNEVMGYNKVAATPDLIDMF